MLDYKLLVHSFSVAIIQYLCSRYDLPEHWYPRKDLKAQAKVNEYLNWQHANTRMNCAMVFRHLVSRDGIVKFVESPGFLVAHILWILWVASLTNLYDETHLYLLVYMQLLTYSWLEREHYSPMIFILILSMSLLNTNAYHYFHYYKLS